MYAYNQNPKLIGKGVDWTAVFLTAAIAIVGLVCIYAAVYKPEEDNPVFTLKFTKSEYTKQVLFFMVAIFLATIILLVDCRFFPAFANILFLTGIVLMLSTLVIGKEIKGSRSWIPLGFFNLQPVELCKIFTALALSKYIASLENQGFKDVTSHIIAALISFGMIGLALLQKELGLSLVYLSFFIPLYREGLPTFYIFAFLGAIVIFIAFVMLSSVNINFLNLILVGKQKVLTSAFVSFIALLIAWFDRKSLLKKRNQWVNYVVALSLSFLLIWAVLPIALTKVLKGYQVTRIFEGFGKKNPYGSEDGAKVKKTDNYNVQQSVIATGSGRFFGKGFLKGTQTGGDFVPEQHTDFIFSSLGENFGFFGCAVLLALYFGLLYRIIMMAERQRSTFSRVYAYSVAGILFFHITINILMAIGMAPVIGITLPLMSYGGSSLLTFTMLIFILIRLDADRGMNLW